jgi:hypothetical protein
MSQHPMFTLWAVADPAKLTNEVLESLNTQIEVGHQLEYLAEMVEGVGCLVAADEKAGSFVSNEELPHFLFSVSETIRNLSAMAWIGHEAQSLLKYRVKESEGAA